MDKKEYVKLITREYRKNNYIEQRILNFMLILSFYTYIGFSIVIDEFNQNIKYTVPILLTSIVSIISITMTYNKKIDKIIDEQVKKEDEENKKKIGVTLKIINFIKCLICFFVPIYFSIYLLIN